MRGAILKTFVGDHNDEEFMAEILVEWTYLPQTYKSPEEFDLVSIEVTDMYIKNSEDKWTPVWYTEMIPQLKTWAKEQEYDVHS